MVERVAIFDMDGTLLDSKRKLKTDVAQALGRLGAQIRPEEIIGDWYDIIKKYSISKEDFEREMGESKSWEASFRDGEMGLFYDSISCLDALQRVGVTLALLTRSNEERTKTKINYFGLSRYFLDRVEITPIIDKNGKEKGARNLIAKLNPSLESKVYFIGDNLEDIDVARMVCEEYKLNARGIYVQRQEPRPEQNLQGYGMVRSLNEIPQIISD